MCVAVLCPLGPLHGSALGNRQLRLSSATVIEFLGHRVSPQGAFPLPAKVEAVSLFPRPLSVKPLQEFLGMVNFYNRFIPRAAHLMHPLYEALRGKKRNQEIEWTLERVQAFEDAKKALANAALLAHPCPLAPVALTTDASDYAVGAVCEQWVNGAWQPLAFFSRKLRDAEKKYSTFDRELLALFLATRHFRFLLEGRDFTAFVDHKPLTFAMAKVSEPWSARQQRHLSAISEFTTDIQHVAGKSNLVADCLSRAQDNPVARSGSLVVNHFGRGCSGFCFSWVARFGVPLDLTSDRGPQFTSELWTAVAETLGVKLYRTTAYHPQANGLCERFHRTMKAALRASLVDNCWADRLPWVMLGLRSAPKEDLRCSSAELVLGQPLRVPGEFLSGFSRSAADTRSRSIPLGEARVFAPVAAHHCLPQSYVPKDLMSAKYVFIRHDAHRSPLQPPYDGPFRVLESGPKDFWLSPTSSTRAPSYFCPCHYPPSLSALQPDRRHGHGPPSHSPPVAVKHSRSGRGACVEDTLLY
ncbi:hypothetical protein WMY93_032222 [Mugilogobius chulae]|uniref:Integrase catalytic domain-containing protein n=1 Tax=Mugilogobius chulae TaxID=88201 RepID=A0AAW0MJ43_9GOBI